MVPGWLSRFPPSLCSACPQKHSDCSARKLILHGHGSDADRFVLANESILLDFPSVGAAVGCPIEVGSTQRRTSQSNLAGDENGLLASTTNKANSCKSAEPLLDTSIGISPP